MTIEKEGFSLEHIPDNDASYFSLLEGVVNSVDVHSTMYVRKYPNGYNFRISPSSPANISNLMEYIIDMNKFLGIKLNFSKSVKTSSIIQFSISTFA